MVVSIVTMVILLLRFSRETKDRQKLEIARQQAETIAAEKRGIEEGRRVESESSMKESLDSAHSKIRSIEAKMEMENRHVSDQLIEQNAKLDNLIQIFQRVEGSIEKQIKKLEDDIFKRVERLEDAG